MSSEIPNIDKQYPEPLATHDEVVKSSSRFWDTLRSFHQVMGTKHRIPIVGGTKLDLHLLYVEVTSLGGYEKVVSDKKWRDISFKFDFSPTIFSSAPFALKTHYNSLLYHYEKVYFFKLQGSILAPKGGETPSGAKPPGNTNVPHDPDDKRSKQKERKRKAEEDPRPPKLVNK